MSELLNTFFLFKQKTAYELRISDWSSDVCSSDLLSAIGLGQGNRNTIHRHSNSKALGIGNEPTFNHDFIPEADVPHPIRLIVVGIGHAYIGRVLRRNTLYGKRPQSPALRKLDPFVCPTALSIWIRSEERCVGKECVSQCRFRWSQEQ